jgi:hypothetical protein
MARSGFWALITANKIAPFGYSAEFKGFMTTEPRLKEHYQKHIMPHVKVYEEKRVKALKSFRSRTLTSIVFFVVAAIAALVLMGLFPHPDTMKIGGVLMFLLFVGLGVWSGAPVNAYKLDVKNQIFPAVFRYFGDDYGYSQLCPVTVESLQPSQLLPYYENSSTEDYVKGTHKGVGFEFFEAKLTKEVRSGKSRRTVTVFDGVFLFFTMNKSFSGQTVVKSDGGAIGNWLGRTLGNMGGGMQNVKLEDPVFEKRFEVFSTDQVEARYLLTPSFMERLLKLAESFKASGVQASMYKNRILLMMSSDLNRFEGASIYVPATFEDDIKMIMEEMQEIFSMIDILKLNERTGL